MSATIPATHDTAILEINKNIYRELRTVYFSGDLARMPTLNPSNCDEDAEGIYGDGTHDHAYVLMRTDVGDVWLQYVQLQIGDDESILMVTRTLRINQQTYSDIDRDEAVDTTAERWLSLGMDRLDAFLNRSIALFSGSLEPEPAVRRYAVVHVIEDETGKAASMLYWTANPIRPFDGDFRLAQLYADNEVAMLMARLIDAGVHAIATLPEGGRIAVASLNLTDEITAR